MGDTAADRQRRHRAHKRGDHSLCSPERCDQTTVTASVTRDSPPTSHFGPPEAPVPRLRARGRWLWQELVEKGNPSPAERVLIAEACRLADRLDRLDAISNGRDRAWLQISDDLDAVAVDGQVTVIVDKVLAEARQQQATLKQILGELRQAASGTPSAVNGPGGSFLDQLAARRKARLADAAGS